MSNVEQLPARQDLAAGGSIAAIVPRSLDDAWRLSRMVLLAGLAPRSLVSNKEVEEAQSAIATVILSGAELGLPPMVSLRSFTVIGGRPALYGDGIINVARRSGKAAYIRTGCDERDGQLVGWCKAKRSDTGEEGEYEFSQADAEAAGLWDDREKVKRKGRNGEPYEAANDAPWHRYPKRMLAWRAAGYLLRELFADVLGGVRDEFEAREVSREPDPETMRDITPAKASPPSPPSPPSVPAGSVAVPPSPAKASRTRTRPRSDTPYNDMAAEREAEKNSAEDGDLFGNATAFDPESWLADLDTQSAACDDFDALNEVWLISGEDRIESGVVSPEDRQKAEDLFEAHVERVRD